MKTCFKCKQVLPIHEFYVHKKMTDGHLGKCKACTKNYEKQRQALKRSTDIEWVLSERKRQREKMRKARSEGKVLVPDGKLRVLLHIKKYPQKYIARCALSNAIRDGKLKRLPCEKCGAKAQAHHDDYSKPLDVRWLCVKHHAEHHVEMNTKAAIEKFKSRNQ